MRLEKKMRKNIKNMWNNAFGNHEGEDAGAFFLSRFVVFGQGQPLLFGGCHKRFGDDWVAFFGDGVADIWIGLKIGYHPKNVFECGQI